MDLNKKVKFIVEYYIDDKFMESFKHSLKGF